MRFDKGLENLMAEFPELSSEDVDWDKEVYAHFGLLFSGYALLEASLHNCYVFEELWLASESKSIGSKENWERAYDVLERKAFAQTLGNLIKLVSKYQEFGELVPELNRLKKKRDYFAHHFFREELKNLSFTERLPGLISAMNILRQSVKASEVSCTEISEQKIKRLAPRMDVVKEVAGLVDTIKETMKSQSLNESSKYGWEDKDAL
jgi:hypothetical protein